MSLIDLSYPEKEPPQIERRLETPEEPFGEVIAKPKQSKDKEMKKGSAQEDIEEKKSDVGPVAEVVCDGPVPSFVEQEVQKNKSSTSKKDIVITFNPYKLVMQNDNPDMMSVTPDDLQNKILEFLPSRDLARTECTSREMYSAASKRKLWDTVGDPREWVSIRYKNYKTTRYRCALFFLCFVYVLLFLVQWGIDLRRMGKLMRMTSPLNFLCFVRIIWYSPNSKTMWTGVAAIVCMNDARASYRMNRTTRKRMKYFVYFSTVFYVLLGLPGAAFPGFFGGVFYCWVFIGFVILLIVLACGLYKCNMLEKLETLLEQVANPLSFLHFVHFIGVFYIALGMEHTGPDPESPSNMLAIGHGHIDGLRNVMVEFMGPSYFENVTTSWENVIVLVNTLL